MAAATKNGAMKADPKQTVPTRDAPTRLTPTRAAVQKRVRRATVARAAKRPRHASPAPAPTMEPAISAVETLGESDTFVLGEPPLS
jgi:hypothetical protein